MKMFDGTHWDLVMHSGATSKHVLELTSVTRPLPQSEAGSLGLNSTTHYLLQSEAGSLAHVSAVAQRNSDATEVSLATGVRSYMSNARFCKSWSLALFVEIQSLAKGNHPW
jgi:hypothetical protein